MSSPKLNMIILHRLKGKPFYLNHNLIELIEEGADTVVVLTNDRKYIVEEKAEQIIDLIHEFERKNFEPQIIRKDDINM